MALVGAIALGLGLWKIASFISDIISAKKVKMYAGDERFMSFGGIMQNLRSGRGTQENREDFLNWFERYGKFSTVSNKFDDWVNDGTISESMVNKATAYIDRYKRGYSL